MKIHRIECAFTSYEKAEDLPPADLELLELARSAREKAYAPYSRFFVGAAVRLENGETMEGANYENAAYPLCICAEQSLLAAAATRFPEVAVEAIAITVRTPRRVLTQPAAPCGGCRQVICETERKNRRDIRIILQAETGPVFVFDKGKDLLPMAFNETFL
jgi:cytidine deaminase